MHKGRKYPYNPNFWVTECLFWPGYAPWKFHGVTGSPNTGPWSNLDASFDQISDAALNVPDFTQVFWNFVLTPPNVADLLVVSIEKETIAGVDYTVWEAKLSIGLVTLAEAWLFQSSPIFACSADFLVWRDVHDPSVPGIELTISFLPATYAEGGSPWS